MRRWRATLVVMALLPGAGSGAWAATCEEAATQAEVTHNLPAGLLRAIGQVESGRSNPAGGPRIAWPWAVGEVAGGRLFDSADQALTWARARMSAGNRSIDIGCFQINMLHHPTAFTSLDEGFDPTANAQVAARLLTNLQGRLGSWEAAAAAYHSSTPARGAAYFQRVLAAWRGPAAVAAWTGAGGPNVRAPSMGRLSAGGGASPARAALQKGDSQFGVPPWARRAEAVAPSATRVIRLIGGMMVHTPGQGPQIIRGFGSGAG